MSTAEAVLPEAELEVFRRALGPVHLPRQYVPVDPTAKQEWFLRRDELEVFFGGSAGPGKSWSLLMSALQYVDIPGYHALLLRPSVTEFEQPGGLIPICHDWLGATDAQWHGGKRQWTFPSGATLRFGYLATTADARIYKGPSYSFCGFDELTSFPEHLYRIMFRVLRQPKGGLLQKVPLRMRSASNPGDIGHHWVKSRFVNDATREPTAVYVPALIQDNPYMDYEAYLKSLSHLSLIDRMRLINGDWDVMEEGGAFKREAFRQIDPNEAEAPVASVRYWDLAASEVSESNPDPDWTVGVKLERSASGRFCIRDIVRGRWTADKVEKAVRAAAEEDGRAVLVYIEQEPGASGKTVLSHFQRKVLAGFACYKGLPRQMGNKEVRARPVSAAVANGHVDLVRGKNFVELLDECAIFPNGPHDDIVDALSGAHTYLTKRPDSGGRRSSSPAKYRIPGVGTMPR